MVVLLVTNYLCLGLLWFRSFYKRIFLRDFTAHAFSVTALKVQHKPVFKIRYVSSCRLTRRFCVKLSRWEALAGCCNWSTAAVSIKHPISWLLTEQNVETDIPNQTQRKGLRWNRSKPNSTPKTRDVIFHLHFSETTLRSSGLQSWASFLSFQTNSCCFYSITSLFIVLSWWHNMQTYSLFLYLPFQLHRLLIKYWSEICLCVFCSEVFLSVLALILRRLWNLFLGWRRHVIPLCHVVLCVGGGGCLRPPAELCPPQPTH